MDPESSTEPTPSGADTQEPQLETSAPATAAPEATTPEKPADTPNAGGEDAKPAESSTAEGVNKDQPLDLASVVRNAAAKLKEDPKVSKSPAETSGQDTKTAPDAEAVAKAKEAGEDVPFAKHPRWQEVLGERKTLRKEVESLKPQAEEWGKVTAFMEVNRLTPEEVAQGFTIMALIKHDPAKALQALAPFIEQAELQVGKRLPPDLQKQVDDGQVTQEVASELSRTRAQNQALQANTETQQRQNENMQAEQRAGVIKNAVVQWEQGISAQDPDYKLKQRVVMAHVRAALATSRPQTAEQAIEICKKAYETASEDVKPLVAKRAPTPPNPGSLHSSTRAAAVPQSLLDVVRQAAGGRR